MKEKNRGNIVRTQFLKEIIFRIINNKHGIPRIMINEIIKDLETLDCLKRIDHTKYQILQNISERRLRKFFW